METKRLETLKQLADGVAAQFGNNCEVVIHDVSSRSSDHSIAYIVNGHVSGRKIGDGGSQIVLDQLASQDKQPRDHLCYLTRTPDGKILKSSSIYIRGSRGTVVAIFSINYDVSGLMMIQQTIGELLSTQDKTEPEKIINVNNVLNELIEQSVALVGQARRPHEQGRQGARHPLSQRVGSLPRDEVRRQGRKILRYFQIHALFLY